MQQFTTHLLQKSMLSGLVKILVATTIYIFSSKINAEQKILVFTASCSFHWLFYTLKPSLCDTFYKMIIYFKISTLFLKFPDPIYEPKLISEVKKFFNSLLFCGSSSETNLSPNFYGPLSISLPSIEFKLVSKISKRIRHWISLSIQEQSFCGIAFFLLHANMIIETTVLGMLRAPKYISSIQFKNKHHFFHN